MNANQYNAVRTSLDVALKAFEVDGGNRSREDQTLFDLLVVIRAEVLKAESGHPFPLAKLASFSALRSMRSIPPRGRESENLSRILIADDQPLCRSIIWAMLKVEGRYELIAEAQDGREAIELAAKYKPDLIIMDLEMPKIGGLEATRAILSQNADAKILVFSASCDSESIRRSASAGALGYLSKPATRAELLTALDKINSGDRTFHYFENSLETNVIR